MERWLGLSGRRGCDPQGEQKKEAFKEGTTAQDESRRGDDSQTSEMRVRRGGRGRDEFNCDRVSCSYPFDEGKARGPFDREKKTNGDPDSASGKGHSARAKCTYRGIAHTNSSSENAGNIEKGKLEVEGMEMRNRRRVPRARIRQHRCEALGWDNGRCLILKDSEKPRRKIHATGRLRESSDKVYELAGENGF